MYTVQPIFDSFLNKEYAKSAHFLAMMTEVEEVNANNSFETGKTLESI